MRVVKVEPRAAERRIAAAVTVIETNVTVRAEREILALARIALSEGYRLRIIPVIAVNALVIAYRKAL